MSPFRQDIAVIGMAGRFPGARTIDEFWNTLFRGINAVTAVTRWNMDHRFSPQTPKPGKTYCKWGAFLEDIDRFDPLFFNIPPKQAQGMDPRQRLMLEVTWETLEHAGYAGKNLSKTKTGVFIGASDNQYLYLDRRLLATHPNGLDNSSGAIANRISYFLNLFGPSLTLDTTCSSSLMALHAACQSIRLGESDTAIAGGIHLILLPDYYITMSQMKLLSPDPRHRVMDRNANGFVPGEGVGAVLLKPLVRAMEDNDTIYAVIKGSAANFSGRTEHMTIPNPDSQKQVVQQAINQSGIDADTVSYIELNGAGTLLGDFAEMQALTAVFKDSREQWKDRLVGSVKTNIGNLEAASGMAGFIKTVLSMNHSKIPPTLHFEKGNRFIKWEETPFSVCTQLRDWPQDHYPYRAGVSSFGVGGTNVHLVVESHDRRFLKPASGARATSVASEPPPVMITLSAHAAGILPKMAENLKKGLKPDTDLKDLSYTLNTGRAHLGYRLALIVTSMDDLLKKLDFIRQAPDGGFHAGDSGIFFSGADARPTEDEPFRRPHPLAQLIEFKKKKRSRPDGPMPVDIDTPPEDPREYMDFLKSTAAEYVKGRFVEWRRLYKAAPRRKLALPSYPFEGRICWVQPDPTGPARQKTDMPSARASDANLSFQAGHAGLSEQEVFERLSRLIVNRVAETMGYTESEIDPDQPLSDYGIDSIRYTALLEYIAQQTGLDPDPDHRFDLSTLSDIARFYAEKSTETGKPAPGSRAYGVSNGCLDVAVIGMACRFPGAENIDRFWENLQNGVDSVTEIPDSRLDVSRYYDPDIRKPGKMCTKWGAFIDDFDCFDAAFFNIHKRAAERMDPQHRLFLEQVWTAFEYAGYSKKDLSCLRAGVFAGLSSQEYAWHILKENGSLTHYDGLGTARSLLANRVSHFFGLTGPSMTVDTACASSLTALHLACRSLNEGDCDLAVAGGANLAFDPSAFVIFSKAGVLTKTGRCRVFDEKADGYARGEGVGVVVLKPLDRAISDGDFVHAIIKGSVINHNGENYSITSPSLKSQIELFEKAYSESGIHPQTLSYIEAGSIGTYQGDPIEIRALAEVFGRYTSRRRYCAVGSTKTYVGHLEAASGIAGLIRVICSMRHKKIPPLLHFSDLNKAINLDESPFYINRKLTDWKRKDGPRRAGLSNFGFGGTNVHVIVEEGPSEEPKTATSTETDPQICTLSAKTPEGLHQLAADIKDYLVSNAPETIKDICYTLTRGRNHFKGYRTAFTVKSKKELTESLSELKIPLEGVKPKGIIFAFGDLDEKSTLTAYLFTKTPLFREEVLSCDHVFEKILGKRCLETLLTREQSGKKIPHRPWNQKIKVALQYAVARVLMAWGVQPNMLIGSRWGQIAAACTAEGLDLESGLRLTATLAESEFEPFPEKRSMKETELFEELLMGIPIKQPKFNLYSLADDSCPAHLSRFFDAFNLRTGTSDAGCLGTDMKARNWIMLEIGRNHPSIPLPTSPASDFNLDSRSLFSKNMNPDEAVPMLLTDLYRAGVDVNWTSVYRNREGKRIPLPTYPFQRKRFWSRSDP